MYVERYMNRNVVTVTGHERVLEALDIMKKNNVRRLPVVKGNRVVGLVTDDLIAKHLPSQSTSLSVHEVNYLLTKTTVEEIMETRVVTIHSSALLEEAAVVMREKKIGVLPVVDHYQLVGIITNSDIFEAFIDVLGFYRPGTRITVELSDEQGQLEQLSSSLAKANFNINQVAVYHQKVGKAEVVIQLSDDNAEGIREVVEKAGIKVLSCMVKTGK